MGQNEENDLGNSSSSTSASPIELDRIILRVPSMHPWAPKCTPISTEEAPLWRISRELAHRPPKTPVLIDERHRRPLRLALWRNGGVACQGYWPDSTSPSRQSWLATCAIRYWGAMVCSVSTLPAPQARTPLPRFIHSPSDGCVPWNSSSTAVPAPLGRSLCFPSVPWAGV